MNVRSIPDALIYEWAMDHPPEHRAAFIDGALEMREQMLTLRDNPLRNLALRFWRDARGERYYERTHTAVNDIDGTVKLDSEVREVTREFIASNYGEAIFHFIPFMP